jgi:chromosome partitioning protein
MIIAVAGVKGGAGKSTIACNLSAMLKARGRNVVLLDADPQGTAADWASIREQGEAQTIPSVQVVRGVFDTAQGLAENYDDVVIDVPGRDGGAIRQAMGAADLVVCPVIPTQADLWSFEQTSELLAEVSNLKKDLSALVVLNRAHTNPRVAETAKARKSVSGLDFVRVAESVVHDRAAYYRGMGAGLTGSESSDPKAAAEMDKLIEEVLNYERICQAA